MLQIGYGLSGLIAAAIIFLGARFWLAPGTAAAGFGIAGSPPPSAGFTAWLSVKGTRDIGSGLFVILLMANSTPRLLGEFLLLASLIAFGDMATVLRSRGSRALAFGMHGLTGLVIVAAGVCLIVGAK
ncbi:DUF4267 domain-containing protein [Mesorhizobium sp. BH1-1-4]|uniref:DUF4267 domain-containing protein n=1 Tax=Mesorhizobium sp. BH1-1-4 TaxID=2876662 RepID=UPI001CD1605A|nr:DUF4267 domain-containing protein [Mesorhizobium sp. BH1-1-4]MBZ9996129.1 DUF4267 domain-containing protein [Mesorhizobium sp. BH1-1-4]